MNHLTCVFGICIIIFAPTRTINARSGRLSMLSALAYQPSTRRYRNSDSLSARRFLDGEMAGADFQVSRRLPSIVGALLALEPQTTALHFVRCAYDDVNIMRSQTGEAARYPVWLTVD